MKNINKRSLMSIKEKEERIISLIKNDNLELLKRERLNYETVRDPNDVYFDTENSPILSLQNPSYIVIAIIYDRPKILEYLWQMHSDAQTAYNNGLLPIHFAAITTETRCLAKLIQLKADINAITKDISQSTPLMLAVSRHNYKAAFLLAHSDQTLQNSNGNTAIHLACLQNDFRMCEILLLDRNCGLSVGNAYGKTAAMIAKENKIRLNQRLKTEKELKEILFYSNDDKDDSVQADLEKQVGELTNNIELLMQKLQTIENEKVDGQAPEVQKSFAQNCEICQALTMRKCRKCHRILCNVCLPEHQCSLTVAEKVTKEEDISCDPDVSEENNIIEEEYKNEEISGDKEDSV